jgi:hypothetical protein
VERRKGTRLRTLLEIAGAIVAAAAVYVAVAQFEYSRHKDAQDMANAVMEKEHNTLVDVLKAEAEARKEGDKKLELVVAELVKSQDEQTRAVTRLVTEMRFILRKLNLDGVAE